MPSSYRFSFTVSGRKVPECEWVVFQSPKLEAPTVVGCVGAIRSPSGVEDQSVRLSRCI